MKCDGDAGEQHEQGGQLRDADDGGDDDGEDVEDEETDEVDDDRLPVFGSIDASAKIEQQLDPVPEQQLKQVHGSPRAQDRSRGGSARTWPEVWRDDAARINSTTTPMLPNTLGPDTLVGPPPLQYFRRRKQPTDRPSADVLRAVMRRFAERPVQPQARRIAGSWRSNRIARSGRVVPQHGPRGSGTVDHIPSRVVDIRCAGKGSIFSYPCSSWLRLQNFVKANTARRVADSTAERVRT